MVFGEKRVSITLVVTASGPHWGYPSTQVFEKPLDVPRFLGALEAVAPTRRTTN